MARSLTRGLGTGINLSWEGWRMNQGYGFEFAALLVFAGIVALVKLVDQSTGGRRLPQPFTQRQLAHLVTTITLLVVGIVLGAQSL